MLKDILDYYTQTYHESGTVAMHKFAGHGAFTLYETTLSWNSEPQNIEQEISNDEVWNRCAQSFFKNNRVG
jgi:hypothetical protein